MEKNALDQSGCKKLMRCKLMKTFNHQDPPPTSAWSEVGRTKVMAMTDIYRLTHPHTIISRHICCKSGLGGAVHVTLFTEVLSFYPVLTRTDNAITCSKYLY